MGCSTVGGRRYLEALEEEDVPDPQQVLEGQRVGEDGDEPVRAVHGRVHPLRLQVRAQRRQLVVDQVLVLRAASESKVSVTTSAVYSMYRAHTTGSIADVLTSFPERELDPIAGTHQ